MTSATARCTATSTPLSSVWDRQFVLGARNDGRVSLYQAALKAAGLPAATLIDYRDAIARPIALAEAVCEASMLRIESPGRDFEVHLALLRHGQLPKGDRLTSIGPDELAAVLPQRGLILCPTQFHKGLEKLLIEIASFLGAPSPALITSDPQDICMMFDKRDCHRLLYESGIPVPRSIAPGTFFHGYDDLRDAMAAARAARVFIKLRYGSSAAGVVAYQARGSRELAITTAEVVRHGDGSVSLYNSRRLRRYEGRSDLRALIDAICRHGAHVEAWYPKASVAGAVCDLRVLMIARKPRHIVLRSSRSPLTNLHLLNHRLDPALLRDRMPSDAWDALLETCRRVAARFPKTLHMGIDVAVRVGFQEHAVLEVNAFGDLLRGVTHEGQSTYEAEIAAIEAGWRP